MNTTTSNTTSRSTASGIHRGIWIGGGLMALTIIALATTLVVKNNNALPDSTATPLVAATDSSSVAQNPAQGAAQPTAPAVVATQSHEATRPVHHTAPARNETRDNNDSEPQRVASVPVCSTCGVIDGYTAVQVQGKNNGVGAVAGGVGGALVGSKIAGRSNHTLGGVIGAVGGGLLGNAIETHQRTSTAYDVRVRMNDGSIRTVRQATIPNVGTRVNVDGNTLHAVDSQG
ncbi:MAG: glycine zipper 2TM domain-containing protein [Betaproteobacteria bacterium]